MDTMRKWIGLSLVAALVILGGGWLLFVSPERQSAAALRDEALLEQSANAQQQTRVEVLRVKAAKLPEKKAEIAAIAARIPAEPALPDLVRALTAAARSAGVELVSVAPGAPVPVAPTETAAVPADPATAPAPAPAETVPAEGAPAAGLSMIPLTISVAGEFYDVEQFVAELEDLRRALRLTALTLAPGGGPSDAGAAIASGRRLTTTITAQVYVSGSPAGGPAAPAGAAVASDAGATGAGTTPTDALPAAAPVN